MKKIIIVWLVLFSAINKGYSQEEYEGIPVKEGPAGVYLFTYFTSDSKAGKVYRSIGDTSHFKPVGTVEMAGNEADFEKIAGRNALNAVARLKKLAGEKAAFDYIRRNNDPKNYGLLSLDAGFLRALGTCFLDDEMKGQAAGTKVFYKVEYTTGKGVAAVPAEIILGARPIIAKPVLSKVREKDSSVSILWTAPAGSSADAVSGIVYRRNGRNGTFVKAGSVLAQRDGQQQNILYRWYEDIEANGNYDYVLVPVTLTELPGPASDTVGVMAHNFKAAPALSIRKALDTANGIFMVWDAVPDPEWYAGILIERSKKNLIDYSVIDTVSIDETSYYDTRVIPNQVYYYRIRLLTIRGTISDQSAYQAVMHNSMDVLPDVPTEVKAEINNGIVHISWMRSQRPIVSDYMVYRSGGYDTSWQLVSTHQKENNFTDTIARLESAQYKYMVRAIAFSGVKSQPSEPAFIQYTNPAAPGTVPLDLKGYAKDGKCILVWRDVKGADNDLVGYNIYRKESNAFPATVLNTSAGLLRDGFKKLNNIAIKAATFSDADVKERGSYVYIVTGVDVNNVEGVPGAPFMLQLAATPLYAPSAVAARNTSSGIIIDWGRSLQEQVEGYEVLRRTEDEATASVIGKVSSGDDSYTDKNVLGGKLYFYSVRTTGNNKTSDRSDEVSVRP